MIRKILSVVLILVVVIALGITVYSRQVNDYQADGRIDLPILDRPVTVIRDEHGVPYIFAQSIDDALRAQGFMAAQDRLFQIEFTKYLSSGRLSELIGPAGLRSDTQFRVVGLGRYGERHAALLDEESRRHYALYLEGLNAYIETQTDEHPLGLRLLGITPQPWTLSDAMTLSYFLNWVSTPNLTEELVALALIDHVGPERAATISQMTVNPDVDVLVPAIAAHRSNAPSGIDSTGLWHQPGPRPFEVGSNNWVFSSLRSAGGMPIVVNDPHIDARQLPGIWHPVGMITPEFRAVGGAGPGTPGLAFGRTSHIAWGITNSYGDGADLFIETVDPNDPTRYLDNGESIPFEVIAETLVIRDRSSETGYREQPLTIRLTRRGPVISDHGMDAGGDQVLSLRWAAPEAMAPDSGAGDLLFARSVEEAGVAIGKTTAPYNYVVADMDGNIAHWTAGRVPVRTIGDGSAPLPGGIGEEAWAGMIPPEQMPGVVNPARGWVGTANHRTLPADFPFSYSTYFASSWRYRRMLELLDNDSQFSAEDHWEFMRDNGNTMAASITPFIVSALAAHDDTADLAERLADWDYSDDADKVAPTIFQVVYRNFAIAVFEDELGPELTARMLDIYYYWHERLHLMIREEHSDWFDDIATDIVETRDGLFHRAALAAKAELTERLGPDVDDWTWGRIHTVTFFSPIVPGEAAAGILGAGTHPKGGSGETINRATFKFNDPYAATTIASARFVADLSDDDKVMAVLVGGASARQFDPHLDDNSEAWLSGEPRYWWFSDDAIHQHQRSALLLTP